MKRRATKGGATEAPTAPPPSLAELDANGVRDLFKRALGDGCGFPPRGADGPERVLALAHELAWRVWYPGFDRSLGADTRAAFEDIAAVTSHDEARKALARLAVARARGRLVAWARDQAFVLLATLARCELRANPDYGSDAARFPEPPSIVHELGRWFTLSGISENVVRLMRSVDVFEWESDDDYCNRAEAVAQAIQERQGKEWSERRRAEQRERGTNLLWLCHEMLRRVNESPESEVADVLGSCASAAVHYAKALGLTDGAGREGPVESFAYLRDGKDLPPLARLDFDRSPRLQAMFVIELREPFEGSQQYLTGWLEDATDPKRITPDMKHGDLAALRAAALRVLPRYIRYLETKRLPGLLTKEEIDACSGPPPSGVMLPPRRRAPGDAPPPAEVESQPAAVLPMPPSASASPAETTPAPRRAKREPVANSAEGRALKELRKAKGAFVATIRGEIVRRLRDKGHLIESAPDARKHDEGVPIEAKGYRLLK